MPCYQPSNFPTGFSTTGRTGYATEAECNQACKEGACCEGTTCSVKPQCQCQGAGTTFKGVGTTCSPNPCLCCSDNGPFSVFATVASLRLNDNGYYTPEYAEILTSALLGNKYELTRSQCGDYLTYKSPPDPRQAGIAFCNVDFMDELQLFPPNGGLPWRLFFSAYRYVRPGFCASMIGVSNTFSGQLKQFVNPIPFNFGFCVPGVGQPPGSVTVEIANALIGAQIPPNGRVMFGSVLLEW